MDIYFSERLLEIRLSRGLSQEAMANLCGVGKRSQLHYEKGERMPDVAYLQHLEGHFRQLHTPIDLVHLITGRTEDSAELAEDERTLIEAYRAATKEGKTTIAQVAAMAPKAKGK